MIRLILIGLVFYFLGKMVKSLFQVSPSARSRASTTKKPKQTPPPFDPSQIEDIDYEEIKEDE